MGLADASEGAHSTWNMRSREGVVLMCRGNKAHGNRTLEEEEGPGEGGEGGRKRGRGEDGEGGEEEEKREEGREGREGEEEEKREEGRGGGGRKTTE